MTTINIGNKKNPDTAAVPAVHSPRHGGEGVSSPTQSRRATRVSSPWTQIVRGEPEPIGGSGSVTSTAATEPPPLAVAASATAPPPNNYNSSSSSQFNSGAQSNSSSPPPVEESVGEGSENDNAGKRPAWNKPSNGAVEVGPVMDAVSWPALSEAARASSKLSQELKSISEPSLSVSIPQGTRSTPTSSPKQVNPSPTANHTGPTRQKSMKRNNSSASSNGGPQHQPSAGQGVEMAPNNPSPKEHTHRSGFGSQSHSGNDHPQRSNSFRNRNGGPHPRGDGSHHHNHRRDQDRGSQDWNTQRSFNGRDSHMHPQRTVPRMMRPPQTPPPPLPNAAQFMHQPQMRAFPPIGFEMQPPLLYVHPPHDPLGLPFVPMRHPMVFPVPDPQLHTRIINQIDYYFSNDNLIKDTFLRRNMDDQGWVRIKLIAGFNKVMILTDNIQLILEAMKMSTVVEVQGDKIRRRNDWMRWVMPSAQPSTASGSQLLGTSGQDMLSAGIQSIALDENISVQNNIQQQPSSGDGAGQFSVQAGGDRSISARNSS